MYNEKFDQYEMNQLCVSANVPIQVAMRNVTEYGKSELYSNNQYHGWEGLDADVYDYVIYATTKGFINIFGQEVPVYPLRNKEGEVLGFELRLGV